MQKNSPQKQIYYQKQPLPMQCNAIRIIREREQIRIYLLCKTLSFASNKYLIIHLDSSLMKNVLKPLKTLSAQIFSQKANIENTEEIKPPAYSINKIKHIAITLILTVMYES